MNKLSQLLQTGKTVFTTSEMVDIWQSTKDTVKSTVYRMVKQKNLIRLKPGLFALSNTIDLFELGCKLVPGSYISLFTVLKRAGIIFQEYQKIYLIAQRPQTLKVHDQTFEYHTINAVIGIPDGIDFNNHSSIASIERAILDLFCLFNTDFSDFKINQFDSEKFRKLAGLYNKKTQKKAEQFLTYFSL